MKNKVLKVICFLFAVIMLIAAVPMSVLAVSDSTLDNPMRNTYIIDDLNNLGFDVDAYKRDESAKYYDVLHLYEFAYPYKNCDQRFYSLFLYVYNPSGKPIDINNKNRVSLSYWGVDESVLTKNLDMVCVGYSYKDGYEHLFYKFQITGAPAIKAVVNPSERQYRVNSIEINYKILGVNYLKDYSIGDHYYCKGYQEYYGYEETKLRFDCYKKETDVIPVEIKSASWFSEKWTGSESSYRYEMTSVYFTIPNYYIKKYGNLDDEKTSGLQEVAGDYYKCVTNGVIVPDDTWVTPFEKVVGKSLDTISSYDKSTVGYGAGFDAYSDLLKQSLYSYNMKTGLFYKSMEINNHLCNVVKQTVEGADYVSADDFLEVYYKYGKNHYANTASILEKNSNVFTELGPRNYIVSVEDESLNSKLTKKYKKDWWKELTGEGTVIQYDDIRPLIEISSSDISDTKTDVAIAENLFIGVDDVKPLQSFYKKYSEDNHIYLMKFDINPYFAEKVSIHRGDNIKLRYSNWDDSAWGTYFEKVVYENFDILTFKFVNESGNSRTVPVSMSPIDIVGSVIGSNVNDPNNSNKEDDDDSMDWLKKLWEWLKELKIGYKILAVVVLIVIVLSIFSLIAKITGVGVKYLFSGVGWLIAAPFKLVGKGVSAPFRAARRVTNKHKTFDSKNKESKANEKQEVWNIKVKEESRPSLFFGVKGNSQGMLEGKSKKKTKNKSEKKKE